MKIFYRKALVYKCDSGDNEIAIRALQSVVFLNNLFFFISSLVSLK